MLSVLWVSDESHATSLCLTALLPETAKGQNTLPLNNFIHYVAQRMNHYSHHCFPP